MDELKQELNKQKDLLLLKESKGGKLLIEQLENEVEGLVDKLIRTFTHATHIELLAIAAQLQVTKALLAMLKESELNVQTLKEEIDENK